MIGVYDSGVGGLSVLRELESIMSGEDFLYYSDGAFCPYGPRDPEFILQRATEISDILIEKGAEIIVVACNTATAASITYLRGKFAVPFIGMEPAIKPAVLHSKSGVVGVLATAGTFKGNLYHSTLDRFSGSVKVIEQVGLGLVETVEKGILDGPEVERLIHNCIDPMISEGADHIVLGCTHYPFLQPVIERLAGPSVTVINPAPAVARQTARVLGDIRPVKTEGRGKRDFLSSGKTDILLRIGARFNLL